MNPLNDRRIPSFHSSGGLRAPWRCLLTAIVLAAAPLAQDARSTQEEWLPGFLDSLNSGDFNRISEFAGRARDAARYWGLYQEFGPLTFGLRESNLYWCQGDLTKAWVGLRFGGSPTRLTAVRRGSYPTGRELIDPVAKDNVGEYLHGYLESVSSGNHFSGAVLVAHHGEVLFQGAYGLAEREPPTRNTVNTRFQIASITKMFIGAAVCQLVERGDMSFSDPISKFIPEYPQHIADQVTVHHLLTHTSGIELDDYPPYNAAARQAESIEGLLAAQIRYIEHLNLGSYEDFEPLNRFDYTNEGIDLLGLIIERVSGMGWEKYLQDHVFIPAGMTHTGLIGGDTEVPDLALGYSLLTPDLQTRESGPRREVRPGSMSNAARPAASGYSTIGDLMRFVDALGTEKILTAESWETMTKPHAESIRGPNIERSYGYTVGINVMEGVRTLGHSGGAPGMSTMLEVYPDFGYVVVVLSNFDSSARSVSGHIRDVLGLHADGR